MKKILTVLILTALFVSCSSDDDTDPNGENGGTETVDKKLIGKWKVEYSKTITPAAYFETVEQITNPDEFHLGLNYPDNARIKEYFGNYGEINVVPESSMFGSKDVWIEIKDNLIIDAYHTSYTSQGFTPKSLRFTSIKDNYIMSGLMKYRYYFEGKTLFIEMITPHLNLERYIISKYSKIDR